MLHYVLQGTGAVIGRQNEAHPVAPFWLSVVPKGAQHGLESGGRVENEMRVDAPPLGQPVPHIVAGSSLHPDLLVACGLVSVRYGPSVGLFDRLRDVVAADLSDRPQVNAAFQGILAEQERPGAGQQAMLAALMTQCLVHLFRQLSSDSSRSLPWLAGLDDLRLSRVLDRILENPATDHTVESLADVAGMSRSAFAAHFAATFGRSPITFVQHVRMQHAAHLLRQDATLSVDEVASRVGYSSRSHFAEAFRKHHGMAPTAFRTVH